MWGKICGWMGQMHFSETVERWGHESAGTGRRASTQTSRGGSLALFLAVVLTGFCMHARQEFKCKRG